MLHAPPPEPQCSVCAATRFTTLVFMMIIFIISSSGELSHAHCCVLLFAHCFAVRWWLLVFFIMFFSSFVFGPTQSWRMLNKCTQLMKSAPQILKSQVIVHENHCVFFFSPRHSLHSQRVCGVTGCFCVNSLRGGVFIHLRFRCGVQMVHRLDYLILWICEFFQLDFRLKTDGCGHLCWVEARVRTKP